jgi:hypothetical protein
MLSAIRFHQRHNPRLPPRHLFPKSLQRRQLRPSHNRPTNGTAHSTNLAGCCSLLATATVYPAVTPIISLVTVTATVTTPTAQVGYTAVVTGLGGVIPTYVAACSGVSRWASACQCWGATAAAVTVQGTLAGTKPTWVMTVTNTVVL